LEGAHPASAPAAPRAAAPSDGGGRWRQARGEDEERRRAGGARGQFCPTKRVARTAEGPAPKTLSSTLGGRGVPAQHLGSAAQPRARASAAAALGYHSYTATSYVDDHFEEEEDEEADEEEDEEEEEEEKEWRRRGARPGGGGGDDKLPEEWEAVWSEPHGAHYYWNTDTDEVSWERPAAPEEPRRPPPPPRKRPPRGGRLLRRGGRRQKRRRRAAEGGRPPRGGRSEALLRLRVRGRRGGTAAPGRRGQRAWHVLRRRVAR